MKKNKPLYTGYEWDLNLIESIWDIVDDIGKNDLKLDYYPPQFEVVTSEQMIDAYSSIGMPIYYNHWSFGKLYSETYKKYRQGEMGLAYEMVINSNPCIAYLMQDNTATMQALVIAHASVGHAAVFKMNYLFKQHTDPNEIMNLLERTKKLVMKLEDEFGQDHVETLLDDLHSLSLYAVDKYPYKEPDSPLDIEAKEHERILNYLKMRDVDFDSLPSKKGMSFDKLLGEFRNFLAQTNRYDVKRTIELEEDNLFRFIESYSLVLTEDELHLVGNIRQIQQYFYPQMQSQVLNEGFACACHYYIMGELYKLGHIDEGSYLEFLQSHTAVCSQTDMAHLNPYALGFAIFSDIKRACENPDEEDYKYLKSVAGKDWRTEWKNIITYYKDESFILQFLSPKVIRKFKLFSLNSSQEYPDSYLVTGIQNEMDVETIRVLLSQQKELDNFKPDIKIKSLDMIDNILTLTYNSYKNRILENEEELLDIIYRLTGYKSQLSNSGEK